MHGRAVIHATGITGEHALTVTLSRAHTEFNNRTPLRFRNEAGSHCEGPAARINCD